MTTNKRKRTTTNSCDEEEACSSKRFTTEDISLGKNTLKNIVEDILFAQDIYERLLNHQLEKLDKLGTNDVDKKLYNVYQKASGYLTSERKRLEGNTRDVNKFLQCLGNEEKKDEVDADENDSVTLEIKKIDAILEDLNGIEAEVDAFTGTKNDKKFLHLEEMIIRNTIKLDNIESFGNSKIRQKRKNAIQFAQLCDGILKSKV